MKSKFIEFVETQVKPLILTEGEKDIYENFGLYIQGFKSDYDLSKGLFVRGVVGAGKTLIFRMGQKFPLTAHRYKMVNSESMVVKFEAHQDSGRYEIGEWCFDDMGTEGEANNYGMRVELLRRLVESRYNLWKDHGVRSHFTTNLTNAEIEERYGERVYNRLGEMCNLIKHPLESSRRGDSSVRVSSPLIKQVKTSAELMHEHLETCKKNQVAIERMIIGAFDHFVKGGKRGDYKIDTRCIDELKSLKMFDLGTDMWAELLKKSIKEESDKHDVIRVRDQAMKNYNPIPLAKHMYLYLQFEKWKTDGMDAEVLKSVIDNKLKTK